jgi:hypothetical protein
MTVIRRILHEEGLFDIWWFGEKSTEELLLSFIWIMTKSGLGVGVLFTKVGQ